MLSSIDIDRIVVSINDELSIEYTDRGTLL
jgi:hypothetical protein